MNRSTFAFFIAILGLTQSAAGEQILHIRKPPATTYSNLTSSQFNALSARSVRVLEDYGPFLIASAPDSVNLASINSETGLTASIDPDAFVLDLGGVVLDTRDPGKVLQSLPSDLALTDYSGSTGLYALQFHSPARPEWLNALKGAGVRVIQYVYRNSYIVAAPAGIEKLRGALGPEVRFAGVLQPFFKLAPALRDATVLAGTARQPVSVLLDSAQDLKSTIAALQSTDPELKMYPKEMDEMLIALSAAPADWKKLASLSTTRWIEPIYQAQASDERASQVGVGHHSTWDATSPGQYKSWLTNLGLSFSNEIVDIVDSGLQNSLGDQSGCLTGASIPGGHQDLNFDDPNDPNRTLRNRLAYACAYNGLTTTNDSFYHGTFIAGLIAGDSTQTGGTGGADSSGYYWGMGVAPGVKFGVSRILTNSGSTPPGESIPGILDSIGQRTITYGAHFQNNSWNFLYDTTYSLTSREMDRLVRDASGNFSSYLNALTIAVSAGNGTTSDYSVHGPGTAKNVITVGATGLPRSGLPGACNTGIVISDIPSNSRMGLAYDLNRFKPDIMAPGRSVTSARTSDATAPNQSASDCATSTGLTPYQAALPSQGGPYGAGHGTSFSTALVTGAAVLAKAKIGGTPSPAMIKAALIGTASSMQGGYNYVLNSTVGWEPSTVQGWGRLDLAKLLQDGTPKVYKDSVSLRFTQAGAYQNFSFTVADPTKPVIAVLVFTDAAANAGQSFTSVNEIDMYLFQGGAVYCDGQYGTPYSYRSSSCWLPDFYNNVKRALIAPNSFSGAFTIQMVASSVNQVAVPGLDSGNPNQDWALFVYNAY